MNLMHPQPLTMNYSKPRNTNIGRYSILKGRNPTVGDPIKMVIIELLYIQVTVYGLNMLYLYTYKYLYMHASLCVCKQLKKHRL